MWDTASVASPGCAVGLFDIITVVLLLLLGDAKGVGVCFQGLYQVNDGQKGKLLLLSLWIFLVVFKVLGVTSTSSGVISSFSSKWLLISVVPFLQDLPLVVEFLLFVLLMFVVFFIVINVGGYFPLP